MSPDKPSLPADYHVHTAYCGHAQGKVVEYVEAALGQGVAEIGFSDHLGRYYLTNSQKKRYWDWGMQERYVGRYVAEVSDVAEVYAKRLPVRIGLEIDYVSGAEDILKSIVDFYPLDFLLGSVHCLPAFGWKHLSRYVRKDTWPIYKEYFAVALAAASSGMFDSLAHLDFIWRYVQWPQGRADKVFEATDAVVSAAAKSGVAVEINANAYLWSQLYKVEGGDPFDMLLESLRTHNAHITIGSDAHKPDMVGKAFPVVAAYLRAKGIRRYTTFCERKAKSVVL